MSLADARCAKLGKQPRRQRDDPRRRPAAAPAAARRSRSAAPSTGSRAAGSCSSNLGARAARVRQRELHVPGHVPAAQPYEVNVKTQPHNPDQVCTRANGAGHVASANVTNIAVHCARVAIPSGLDTTFGSGGRVSTPVGDTGQGEAVADPAERRDRDRRLAPGRQHLPLTSRSPATTPPATSTPASAPDGIAITDLGGADDKAYDAALLPDGGSSPSAWPTPPGLRTATSAIARYNARRPAEHRASASAGSSRPTSRGGGDRGERGRCPARRQDRRRRVRGRPSGSTSTSRSRATTPTARSTAASAANGIVTTDSAAATTPPMGSAIQSDGKIVAVGVAGENIALARYLPDGALDPTFNGAAPRSSTSASTMSPTASP